MPDYIVSADAGNGGTNVVMAKKNGGYKRFYEPSVRAIATGDSLGLGKDFEVQYEYVDWYGSRYVTGDDVIRVTRRGLNGTWAATVTVMSSTNFWWRMHWPGWVSKRVKWT